jgi:hypothetical protein
MAMEKSDWFAAITAILALGGGLYMSTYRKAIIRGAGITFLVLAASGLIFWFGYYRNPADAENRRGDSITNSGTIISVPGSNNTITNIAPTQPGPIVGRVAHFQFTQRQIASSNPDLPFALQITILTDAVIENPAFVITCDGQISEGHAGTGAGVYTMMMKLITDDKRSFGFRWAAPSFVPETPLTVTLFSITEIHCLELKDARLMQFKIR